MGFLCPHGTNLPNCLTHGSDLCVQVKENILRSLVGRGVYTCLRQPWIEGQADSETFEGCSVTCFPFDYPLEKVGMYFPEFKFKTRYSKRCETWYHGVQQVLAPTVGTVMTGHPQSQNF